MLRAVIFDMDGVIIDSEPIYYRICNEFLKCNGANMSKDEYYTYVGKPAEAIWNELKNKYSLKESTQELIRKNRENYINYLRNSTTEKAIDGVSKLIRELHENNIRLAIASSASLENIKLVLHKFELNNYFEIIVSGDEIKEGKSSPRIFLYAIEKLGVKVDECIVIEDSREGVESAKKAGIRCIAISNPSSGKQDIKKSDLIIKGFNEVSHSKLCELCNK